MIAKTLLRSACLVASVSACFAQTTSAPYFCSAGVSANGFIDFSKLPKPLAKAGGAFSATIPVTGIAGLNVTISAPAVDTPLDDPTQAQDSTSLRVQGGNRNVTFTFSKPVKGVRLVAETSGRFSQDFSLNAKSTDEFIPGIAFTSSTSQDVPGAGYTTKTPLQVEEQDSATIQSVILSFAGDPVEYYSFTINNVRVEAGASDPSSVVPKNGLAQWFRADQGIITDGTPNGNVTGWADVSGGGAGAIQDEPSFGPIFVAQSSANCQPSVLFQGSAFLKANLPINGLTGMTVFLVSKARTDSADGPYHSTHTAIDWPQNARWGLTYVSPFQTHIAFRFGTGQVNNAPEVLRPLTLGGDFSITTAVHNGSTDTLFVNGQLISTYTGRSSTLAGASGEQFIGMDDQGRYFNGEISEVLVYKRALSDTERNTVVRYLMTKYGPF
jgi:hypothetical protein